MRTLLFIIAIFCAVVLGALVTDHFSARRYQPHAILCDGRGHWTVTNKDGLPWRVRPSREGAEDDLVFQIRWDAGEFASPTPSPTPAITDWKECR